MWLALSGLVACGVQCLGLVSAVVLFGCAADVMPVDGPGPSLPIPGKPDVAGPVALRLRAVGDVMMGTDFPAGYLPPDDGAHLFIDVAEWLSGADVTFANLEGPLCDGGETHKCGGSGACYAFRTPTRYGRYLSDVGVDMVSLANNHALDFGEGCRAETMMALDDLGVAHSGRPGTVGSVEVTTMDGRPMRLGLVAFHSARHSNYLNDHAAAAALVREVDATHDLVVVSFHGGAEGSSAQHVPDETEYFYGENRGHLRRFARAVVDAGADLVLGHGPHVLRGLEVYRGRLVAYSLGNFATYGRFSLSGPKGVTVVLEAQIDVEGRFSRGRLLPVRLVDRGFPVQDDEGSGIAIIKELTLADFPSSGVWVGDDGQLGPPAGGAR